MKKQSEPKSQVITELEEARISDYNGKPVLILPIGGGFNFTFGLTKAKCILENLEEIQNFVGSNGKTLRKK